MTRSVSRRRELRRIWRALRALDEHDWEILLLRHVERLTKVEVAQVLGVSAEEAVIRHGEAIHAFWLELRRQPM